MNGTTTAMLTSEKERFLKERSQIEQHAKTIEKKCSSLFSVAVPVPVAASQHHEALLDANVCTCPRGYIVADSKDIPAQVRAFSKTKVCRPQTISLDVSALVEPFQRRYDQAKMNMDHNLQIQKTHNSALGLEKQKLSHNESELKSPVRIGNDSVDSPIFNHRATQLKNFMLIAIIDQTKGTIHELENKLKSISQKVDDTRSFAEQEKKVLELETQKMITKKIINAFVESENHCKGCPPNWILSPTVPGKCTQKSNQYH